MFATTATKESITVFFPGVGPKTVLRTSPNYEKVREALNDKAWDSLLEIMDPTDSITKWGNGSLTVINGMVHINGEPLASDTLSQKVLDMWEAGFPIDPYIAFNERLQQLTSHRISSVLFTYLERHQFPLFEDGGFMAYKGLSKNHHKGDDKLTEEKAQTLLSRSPQNPYTSINGRRLTEPGYYLELLKTRDYLDVHSHSVPQSVDDTVSMQTRYVNDDPSEGCSTGLHVGSNSYTCNYDTRMLVKVYPANCIAVPLDSYFSKIRVDEYTIIGVDTAKVDYPQHVYTPPVSEDDEEDDDYYDDDDNDDDDDGEY